ncbi:MAG: aspartate carbamoyltransferase regulatory subunit [Bacteroidales bacterium]|jgi:aspartate carbamoyltransferase regulatory subunit|nr:aspartate carbamoyltransferase regulatory subunit [Bacteroidales bacterium]
MENQSKELKVSAIKNGTVLDHIPADQLFRVIDILKLYNCRNQITFGTNLDSKQLGKKGIIKIADRYFRDDEINKIAIIAPQAKINIIKDFEVIEKKIISVPDEITGIIRCDNPNCVTNHQPITTKFKTIRKEGHVSFLCNYCEKITDGDNITIIQNNE